MSRLIDINALKKMLECRIKDCNPDHFDGHETFTNKIDAHDSYGEWQFANGFNMGITAAIVDIEQTYTIDADNLITTHEDIGYEKGFRDGYAEALEMIDNVVPVKHGHWVVKPLYYRSDAKCFVCGTCDKPVWWVSDYCPNCGAKMEK